MAHFCEIDENNIVTRVLVVSNDQEHRGQEFLAEDLGLGGRWIQTSYNNNFRRTYAGIGYIYNEELDVFIYPQPYPSWILDSNGYWLPPVQKPISLANEIFIWNETEQIWEKYDMII